MTVSESVNKYHLSVSVNSLWEIFLLYILLPFVEQIA